MRVDIPIRVSAKQTLFVAYDLIDSPVVLVCVHACCGIHAVVDRSPCKVRIGGGPIMKNVCHHVRCRIDPIRTDYVQFAVANELLSRFRIVDWRVSSEIAAQLRGRGSAALERNSISPSKPFVIEKEKSMLSSNWSTNRCAELVLNELRARNAARIVEKIVGIENSVP